MICKPIPKEDCYELVEPLVFWVDYKRREAHAGFRFKGSIPKIFWSMVTNPYDPKCVRGFAIHDYLYETHLCSREAADIKLKQCLLNDGKDKETAETIFATVRFVGSIAWRKKQCLKK